ncbi:MAG TPA: hypothetical protein V6D29_03155, partial [Leptolyngbyaceae cyanobacterium]
RTGSRLINPLCFLIMLIWGASGLFFFRKMGIPLLSHTFFYMAVPDWDIPLYRGTGLRFLIHRSWLFHSVLLPMGLLGLWLWFSQNRTLSQFMRSLNNLMRDCAIGLSVGMCGHLLWDALLSSTRRGFYIHSWGSSASYLWLLINLAVGLGVPLAIAKNLQPMKNFSRNDS